MPEHVKSRGNGEGRKIPAENVLGESFLERDIDRWSCLNFYRTFRRSPLDSFSVLERSALRQIE